MRVISRRPIRAFVKIHPDAAEPLEHWWRVVLKAAWSNLIEVRNDFRHADAVGKYTVFNIAGNKYRLIATIKYRCRVLYIRDYDQGAWKQ